MSVWPNGSKGATLGAPFGTPRGTRDLLPSEAELRRRVEARVRQVFAGFGYREVQTPVFEREAVLAQGAAPGQEDYLFRFFSPDGEMLALRSDLTTPIARLVTQRLARERRPLRLSYLADVCRWAEPGGGRQRQFAQAGVELVGAGGPAADAEVVLVALKALEAAGIRDYRLDLGQVAFFTGLLAGSGLGRAEQEAVHRNFLAKDWVGLETTLARLCPAADRERILALTGLRGGREVLKQAGELTGTGDTEARRALTNLSAVWTVLADFGVADRLAVDLGLVKDLAYYTGLVVEGYVPRLGYTLCTGGRYDGLYGQFGAAEPATGFALGLERVTEALARQGVVAEVAAAVRPVLVVAEGRRREALRLAEVLWQAGVAVAWEVTGRTPAAVAAAGEAALALPAEGGAEWWERAAADGRAPAAGGVATGARLPGASLEAWAEWVKRRRG